MTPEEKERIDHLRAFALEAKKQDNNPNIK